MPYTTSQAWGHPCLKLLQAAKGHQTASMAKPHLKSKAWNPNPQTSPSSTRWSLTFNRESSGSPQWRIAINPRHFYETVDCCTLLACPTTSTRAEVERTGTAGSRVVGQITCAVATRTETRGVLRYPNAACRDFIQPVFEALGRKLIDSTRLNGRRPYDMMFLNDAAKDVALAVDRKLAEIRHHARMIADAKACRTRLN